MASLTPSRHLTFFGDCLNPTHNKVHLGNVERDLATPDVKARAPDDHVYISSCGDSDRDTGEEAEC
jgi:hypothetical protein